MFSMTNQSR